MREEKLGAAGVSVFPRSESRNQGIFASTQGKGIKPHVNVQQAPDEALAGKIAATHQ